MPAFMIAFIDMVDESWREAYRQVVPDMLRRYGGEYLVRSNGREVHKLEGDLPAPGVVGVFRFPDMASLKGFMDSEEYRPFKEARLAGTVSEIVAFEGDEG